MKEENPLVIPYGDMLLLVAALVAWAERLPERKMLGLLSLTWLGGRFLEGFVNTGAVWHWSLARAAVIVVFLVMAWRRASHPMQALIVPSLVLLSQDLLIVNEPGVLPPEHWLFAAGFFLAALFTSQTYWGTAVGVSGGLVLSELFNLFALKGIVLHRDIPDPFLWHFTLAGLVVSALGQKAWHLFKRRRGESLGTESLEPEGLESESLGPELSRTDDPFPGEGLPAGAGPAFGAGSSFREGSDFGEGLSEGEGLSSEEGPGSLSLKGSGSLSEEGLYLWRRQSPAEDTPFGQEVSSPDGWFAQGSEVYEEGPLSAEKSCPGAKGSDGRRGPAGGKVSVGREISPDGKAPMTEKIPVSEKAPAGEKPSVTEEVSPATRQP
ncbi:Hypothetical protein DEACI_2702 [Acididesulfobacillus acetoxydans]|uniref:Uncharacterized protein n=2 Tax=Acididesulfobacillus acetoxydans TaxID=1561005 RepID=A0A8S0X5X9_9FIRM|nr:Hypothetical protein DEACI_2702 [Acididesulfobacillus acetoxydans]CEJ08127.1 Hypothetical protein DEACI_2602 [Acididesulfobacillus acetoxydans]